MHQDVWAIVLAAGTGSRAGGEPKQYRRIGGRTVLSRALDIFEEAGVPVVVVADDPEGARERGGLDSRGHVRAVVAGGARRQDSVAAGLAAVPGTVEIVAVHDAARPFAKAGLLEAGVDAVRAGADAAVPAVEVADTLKAVAADGSVVETPDRDSLRAAQTPQVFAAAALRDAHAAVTADVTDDAAMVEMRGGRVVTVPGDPTNVKLTHAVDLEVAAARFEPERVDVAVGLGFDVHAFGGPGPLRLAGVDVEHEAGLAGHSDGDVVAHAVADALLGAAGLGDIGMLFPDTDPAYAGADSMRLLGQVVDQAKASGWHVTSVDVTIVCERPRVGPHREAMRTRLAVVLGVDATRVNVKATTTEKLGFTGRGEGIAAQAVATLVRT
ncbi:MAG: 2-C-methyl-D-erythritol 4-phosphate cytidylyltransferase [Acidimicrobiia bacterium]|nr:2-C-methyl-D-erythritol 4-phosphate cytidylyltransferase [Acidimicrobiia bacterium]